MRCYWLHNERRWGLPPQAAARQGACVHAAIDHELAVHHHIVDPDRELLPLFRRRGR